MEKGLSITFVGMSVVFAVLIIIMLGIYILNFVEKFMPEQAAPAPAPRPTPSPVTAEGALAPTDEEVAAMKAAFAHHLKMKPDQFDLEIR